MMPRRLPLMLFRCYAMPPRAILRHDDAAFHTLRHYDAAA